MLCSFKSEKERLFKDRKFAWVCDARISSSILIDMAFGALTTKGSRSQALKNKQKQLELLTERMKACLFKHGQALLLAQGRKEVKWGRNFFSHGRNLFLKQAHFEIWREDWIERVPELHF